MKESGEREGGPETADNNNEPLRVLDNLSVLLYFHGNCISELC